MTIGFCGGTGAGKSTLAEYAATILGKEDTLIISQDHYYKHHPERTCKERANMNFDHPSAIDFELLSTHINILRKGNIINRPVYCFENHLRKKETVVCMPKKHILVEGILIFTYPALVEQFDLKVYIEATKQIRVKRRIARDVTFRGRTEKEVKKRFQNIMHNMHEQFIEPYKLHSDLILTNNNEIETAKTKLKEELEKQVWHEKIT